MSEEQLKAFWNAVQADAGLQKQLRSAGTPDDLIQLAKNAGYKVSEADLKQAQLELSEEELEQGVAGGQAINTGVGYCCNCGCTSPPQCGRVGLGGACVGEE